MSEENTQCLSALPVTPGPSNTGRPLPFDIVLCLAKYMPISKVKLALLGWNTAEEDKKEVLHRRSNILTYMKQFFEEPKRVLDLMRACGVIWSGSRAQEFFTPDTCRPESKLDFYCIPRGAGRRLSGKNVFMFHMQQEFGVKWEDALDTDAFGIASIPVMHRDPYGEATFSAQKGTLRYNGVEWPIQVTHSIDQCRLATSHIFDFHSTVTQSFISGYGAVSLYDDYTSNYEFVRWSQNNPNFLKRAPVQTFGCIPMSTLNVWHHRLEPNFKDPDKTIQKFESRGFKLVEYGSRGVSTHGGGKRRMRFIGDSGPLKISFEPYLKDAKLEFPFEVYWNAIENICWCETATKTAWGPGILDTLESTLESIVDHQFGRRILDCPWNEQRGGSNQVFDLGGRGAWFDCWSREAFDHLKHKLPLAQTLDDFKRYYWTETLARYPC